jgi:hypothetical protein
VHRQDETGRARRIDGTPVTIRGHFDGIGYSGKRSMITALLMLVARQSSARAAPGHALGQHIGVHSRVALAKTIRRSIRTFIRAALSTMNWANRSL